MSDVLELERRGWEALSVGYGEARRFYDEVLAEEVTMLLPGGALLDNRAVILDAMSGAPWTWYELDDARVVTLTDAAAVVAYRVRAQRGDEDVYEALVSSTFVHRDEGWKMSLHQQTPVS